MVDRTAEHTNEVDFNILSLLGIGQAGSKLECSPLSDLSSWYVLNAYSQNEHVVASKLLAQRFRIYLPTIPRVTLHGRTKSIVRRVCAMFPGYLFINVSPERRRARLVRFRNCRATYLQNPHGYSTISHEKLEQIFRAEQSAFERAAQGLLPRYLKLGSALSAAPIEALHGRDRVRLLLQLVTPAATGKSQTTSAGSNEGHGSLLGERDCGGQQRGVSVAGLL